MTGGGRQAAELLLITLSNIGDAVLTTPVLQALHARHPGARVDIVTDARSAELFRHCPWRGELLLRDKRRGWRGTLELLGRLRRQRYELVVDLRTDGLAWLLRARRRRTRRDARRAGGHAVERHMAVLDGGMRDGAIPPVCTWLSAAERRFARERLAGLPGERWLALGPGARWLPKRWPPAHFAALVDSLRGDFDALLLLGSAAERDLCRELAAASALPCLDMCGRTTLLEAAAVVERARLFAGNDSGLGHLAAAVGTPTVTLFGPGDPQRYRPWQPQGRWLQGRDGRLDALSPWDVARCIREACA